MDRTLFGFIWRYSRAQQLLVVALSLVSLPVLYLTLELPKLIVNDAIGRAGEPRLLFGTEYSAIGWLLLLCGAYLVAILINGALRYTVNRAKSRIGERMVRRLRHQLVERVLRFPLAHFARVSQGEIIAAATTETTPLGAYIGDSLALPLLQGGTMLTILAFLFIQDWILGSASLVLMVVQAGIVPRLQKRVNQLDRERIREVRRLSERLGEVSAGVRDIRLHGLARHVMADISAHLGRLYDIRFALSERRFLVLYVNQLISQLTPLLFFLVGGILVIQGDLTLGALVAALNANKDLNVPWTQLLNFYQRHQEAQIKYEQIAEQFDPPGLLPESPLEAADAAQPLDQALIVRDLTVATEGGERIIQQASFTAAPGSAVAIVGDTPSRRARLAAVLAGLAEPAGGSVSLGGRRLQEIPAAARAARWGYSGPDPFLFRGTILDNMMIGLRQLPPPEAPERQTAERRRQLHEARLAGNSVDPVGRGWRGFRADVPATAEAAQNVDAPSPWWVEIVDAIGAAEVLYARGLLEVFDPARRPALAQRFLAARGLVAERLAGEGLDRAVHRFDPARYNPAAALADNLLFGVPAGPDLAPERLAADPEIAAALAASGLGPLIEARVLALPQLLPPLLKGAAPGDDVLQRFDFIDAEALERLESLALPAARGQLKQEDRSWLAGLVLRLSPERHRLDLIDPAVEAAALDARQRLATAPGLAGRVHRYDAEAWNPGLSVFANILYGRLADPAAAPAVERVVDQAIAQLGLRETVMALLAESEVGIGGARVPMIARQRMSLGRWLMKRPDVLVLHEALTAMDPAGRRRVLAAVRHLLPHTTLVVIDDAVADPALFDQVLELRDGRLFGEGGGEAAAPEAPLAVAEDAQASTGDPLEPIAHLPLWQGLAPDQRRRLALTASVVTAPPGRVLAQAGRPVEAVFVPVLGRLIGAEADGAAPAGSAALLQHRPWPTSLVAESAAVAVRLEADAFLALMRADGTRALLLAGLLAQAGQAVQDQPQAA